MKTAEEKIGKVCWLILILALAFCCSAVTTIINGGGYLFENGPYAILLGLSLFVLAVGISILIARWLGKDP